VLGAASAGSPAGLTCCGAGGVAAGAGGGAGNGGVGSDCTGGDGALGTGCTGVVGTDSTTDSTVPAASAATSSGEIAEAEETAKAEAASRAPATNIVKRSENLDGAPDSPVGRGKIPPRMDLVGTSDSYPETGRAYPATRPRNLVAAAGSIR
jgi:hypothetical protein